MSGLQIQKTDDRLVLSSRMDARRVAIGCAGFAAASLCLALLGALGLVFEATRERTVAEVDVAEFLNPAHNHFGFLWILCCIVLAATVPIYLWRVQRAGLVIAFDREAGVLTRNGRIVTRLARIEFVRLLRTVDSAGRTLHRVSILHDDGHDLVLDESYDPDDLRPVAAEITDFLGVDLRRSP